MKRETPKVKPFLHRKLRGKIIEVYSTLTAFAKTMGFTLRTLEMKMSCVTPFTNFEIAKIKRLLNISVRELYLYFFTEKEIEYLDGDEN